MTTEQDEFPFSTGLEFSAFSSVKKISKPEIMGRELWQQLYVRNPDFGGMITGFFGLQGSGKTSLMLRLAKKILETNPSETVFWREPWNVPLQAERISMPLRIFSERKLMVQIKELTKDGAVPTDDLSVRYFTRPAELMKYVEPGCINLVYFDHRKSWLRLMSSMKKNLSWQSFFIDEIEDILPARCSGRDWHLNENFCETIKELRKSRISLYYNSQNEFDLDFRIKGKTMATCYLFGSRKDEHSPMFRWALQNIKRGEGWLVAGNSLFGRIQFKPVLPKEKSYIAIPRRQHET